MKKYLVLFITLLVLVGIGDCAYLTYEHFSNIIPPCTTGIFAFDCGKVLQSMYSNFLGFPLAVLGLLHYFLFLFWIILNMRKQWKYKILIALQGSIGLCVSLYLIYIQLGVLHSICIYCMVSAVNSIVLFFLSLFILKSELTFERNVGYNE